MKKYSINSMKFIGGNEEFERYTYTITFNRSLEHTGKLLGIEKGLNDYDKSKWTLFVEAFINLFKNGKR